MNRFRLIEQRTDADCAICCTAMALHQSYHIVAEVPGVDPNEGWQSHLFESVWEHFGKKITAQPRLWDTRQPAIITVPSRLNEGDWHAVYYEPGVIYDPTIKTRPYNLIAALTDYVRVWQWTDLVALE